MPFNIEAETNISVKMATRGRPELALESMKSCIETADDPSGIEFLVAVDDDDQATIDYVNNTMVPYFEEADVDFQCFVQPRLGYARLNVYDNQLATESRGRWLLTWNDDARMESKGWDTEVLSHNGQFAVLRMQDNHGHPYAIFPIIPRDWVVFFGTCSPFPYIDAWISQVAYPNDAVIQLKSRCLHDRHDLTGNNNDDTYKERDLTREGNPDRPGDFLHKDTVNLRWQWTLKMNWLRKRLGQDNGFFDSVQEGKANYNDKLLEQDTKGFLTTYKVST